jgi:archaellum biogenesis ATPase FlaH
MKKMELDLFKEIVNNKFLLILMEEEDYSMRLAEIIKSVERTKTKICYVCLSKPYYEIVQDLHDMGIDDKNFFFIDVMSSHYSEPEPRNNVAFVKSPDDLEVIKDAIRQSIEKEKCSVILIDTISTLLIYQEKSSIVRFTHDLLSEREQENVKKLFIVFKEANHDVDRKTLTDDLQMFADNKIDLTK